MSRLIAVLLFAWWVYLSFAGADWITVIGLAIAIMIIETSEKGKR